jgi:hypothetical protein
MNTKKVLGFSGAAVMALGTFMPIVSLPIVGSINYFNNGQGDGLFIIIFSAVAAALAGFGLYKFLWLPGAVSSVLLLVTLSRFIQVMNEAKAKLSDSLEGNPFAGLATGLMNSVQLQFGWMFLFLGSLALILASFAPEAKKINSVNSVELVTEADSE